MIPVAIWRLLPRSSSDAEPDRDRDRYLVVNVFQSTSFCAMVLLLVQLGYLAKRQISAFTLAAGQGHTAQFSPTNSI